jgi:penicillin amidase
MGNRNKILFSLFILFIIINYSINSFLKPVEVFYEGINSQLSLSEDVEVFFDDYGVPSVFAENDSDMFKVAGYIGARDRFFKWLS